MNKEGASNYFELTRQFEKGYESEKLKELSAYYSNRMSYTEVEKLIERQTGEKLLSGQQIRQIVVDKAVEISKQIGSNVKAVTEGIDMPEVAKVVDIYNPKQKEILLYDDAIVVKEQKETREKPCDKDDELERQIKEKPRAYVSTNVMMLEKATGSFEYVSETIDEKGNEIVPLVEVMRSKIITQYTEAIVPLPIVAITDGAKSIRSRLIAIFGVMITLILDWYHLTKKVKEYLSMIAANKEDKLLYLQYILEKLWRGKTLDVIEYLKTQVKAKNPTKLKDFISYLHKHKDEIIDYERRQFSGKTIGSGRMEKGVDQVIGFRQKKKGCSWSSIGSKALAILKVVELNGHWLDLWFPLPFSS